MLYKYSLKLDIPGIYTILTRKNLRVMGVYNAF